MLVTCDRSAIPHELEECTLKHDPKFYTPVEEWPKKVPTMFAY